MKKSVLLFLFCFVPALFAQDITNTLASNGIFYIKDASNNYFTLTQSTGEVNILNSLRLEETGNSSKVGIIFKGDDRFIHDFVPTSATGYNTFIGINSGNFSMTYSSGSDASYNTGIGYNTLTNLTTGYTNTAIGTSSLSSLTAGVDNTAVGHESLMSTTTGNYNTAIGAAALSSNTIGANNTAIGTGALYANTSGYANTAIGQNAGITITTGNNCTFLGYNALPSSATATNEITLGNSSVATLRCQVTSITSLSDIRDKKNIEDLSLGLNFLMKLKPRQFNWDKREWYENNVSDGSKMKEILTAGFIAQELDNIQREEDAEWLNLVYKSNPDKWEATYGNLMPVIVNAIQELKLLNDKLTAENKQLKKQLTVLHNIDSGINEIRQLKEELTEQLKLVKKYNKKGKIEIVSVDD